MLYIPKIDNYLEILIDEELKDFVAINFSESIKEEKNLRKVAKSISFFLATPDNCIDYYSVKVLNLFDPELQLINTKRAIKTNYDNC